MNSAIVVDADFDHVWPWAADHLLQLCRTQGAVQFVRLPYGTSPALHTAFHDLDAITRLVCLGPTFKAEDLKALPHLRELAAPIVQDSELAQQLQQAGVRVIWQRSEGFWGASVAEFALALTLCGLRRIPQTYRSMLQDLKVWDYSQPDRRGRPGQRGIQFGDDPNFANGTLEGKRVRVVGAGNIGSRYASYCHALGAEVAIWDPLASEPCFHRSGARREYHLERLVVDAEIFAPMLPLTSKTKRLIKGEILRTLPRGCLVVMVTRSQICEAEVIYERVLKDELALAADVFEQEPLPLEHALLGRSNVVHTPHNAGRTKEANFAFARMLMEQFNP